MGSSPVAVLIIVGCYTAFFAVISASTEPSEADASGVIDTDCGLVCGLGDIIGIIFDVMEFIFDALTFNVEGAPFYIRVPIAVMINASLIWSVASLIRGTEG